MRTVTSPRPAYGALRTRMVSRLTGVTLRQLWLWHNTGLLEAHVIPGAPGYPRLYSWIDYMKIRAAKKLVNEGLSIRRIRVAIDYLDRDLPEWYLLPVYGLSGEVIIERKGTIFVANQARQQAFSSVLESMLRSLIEEGSLGDLNRFSDSIEMNPEIVSGNPVIRGTRLETHFIAMLTNNGVPVDQVASVYRLTSRQVQRAIEFDVAAA